MQQFQKKQNDKMQIQEMLDDAMAIALSDDEGAEDKVINQVLSESVDINAQVTSNFTVHYLFLWNPLISPMFQSCFKCIKINHLSTVLTGHVIFDKRLYDYLFWSIITIIVVGESSDTNQNLISHSINNNRACFIL